jgi:hypothetical protein
VLNDEYIIAQGYVLMHERNKFGPYNNPTSVLYYHHSWAEDENTVIDLTKRRKIFDKKEYYHRFDVRECRLLRYSVEELTNILLKWDSYVRKWTDDEYAEILKVGGPLCGPIYDGNLLDYDCLLRAFGE